MSKVCKNMIIVGWLFLLLLPGRVGWAQEQREAVRSRMPKEIQEAQREAEKSDIALIVEEVKEKVRKLLGEGLPIFKVKTRCNLIPTRRKGDQNDCLPSIDQGPPAGAVVTVVGPPAGPPTSSHPPFGRAVGHPASHPHPDGPPFGRGVGPPHGPLPGKAR